MATWYFSHWLANGSRFSGDTANPLTYPVSADVTLTAVYSESGLLPTTLSFACSPVHGIVPWSANISGALLSSGVGVPNATVLIETLFQGSWVYTGISFPVVNGAYAGLFPFEEINGWVAGVSQPLRARFAGDTTYSESISAQTIQVTMDTGPTTINLNVVAEAGGQVSPQGTLTLTVGQSYQFFETEAVGYNFNYWDLSGENKGSGASLILLITSDMNGKTLTARFVTEPPAQVTVTLAVAGSGAPDIGTGAKTFNVGAVVTITAVPQAGATFNGWLLDGASYSTDNPLQLMVTQDLNGRTLTANFSVLQNEFPIWLVIVVGVGAAGAYFLGRRRKSRR